MMSKEWFFRTESGDSGPYSAREMRAFAQAGRIEPDTQIRKGFHGSWVPGERVKGLFDPGRTEQAPVSSILARQSGCADIVNVANERQPAHTIVPTARPQLAGHSRRTPWIPVGAAACGLALFALVFIAVVVLRVKSTTSIEAVAKATKTRSRNLATESTRDKTKNEAPRSTDMLVATGSERRNVVADVLPTSDAREAEVESSSRSWDFILHESELAGAEIEPDWSHDIDYVRKEGLLIGPGAAGLDSSSTHSFQKVKTEVERWDIDLDVYLYQSEDAAKLAMKQDRISHFTPTERSAPSRPPLKNYEFGRPNRSAITENVFFSQSIPIPPLGDDAFCYCWESFAPTIVFRVGRVKADVQVSIAIPARNRTYHDESCFKQAIDLARLQEQKIRKLLGIDWAPKRGTEILASKETRREGDCAETSQPEHGQARQISVVRRDPAKLELSERYVADVEAKRREDPIEFFGAREITLDMTRSEFLRLYTPIHSDASATADASSNTCLTVAEDKFGWTMYLVPAKDGPYTSIAVEFVDEAMLKIMILYDEDAISDLGGLASLTTHVRDRFPKPDFELDMRREVGVTGMRIDSGCAYMTWKTQNPSRDITYNAVGGVLDSKPPTATLIGVDGTINEKWQARKESRDPFSAVSRASSNATQAAVFEGPVETFELPPIHQMKRPTDLDSVAAQKVADGIRLLRARSWCAAANEFDEALKLDPGLAFKEVSSLGGIVLIAIRATLSESGCSEQKLEEAIDLYREAQSASDAGKYTEAISKYKLAVQLAPSFSWSANNLAWLLATCPDPILRDGRLAIQYAIIACRASNWQYWSFQSTLAAALAEAGRYEEAVILHKLSKENFRGTRGTEEGLDEVEWALNLKRLQNRQRPEYNE